MINSHIFQVVTLFIICYAQESQLDPSDFFVESEKPFVPVLSSRPSDDNVRETPRNIFGRINFPMQQLLSQQRDLVNRRQQILQSQRRAPINRLESLPGPVAVSLETPSATVSLTPSQSIGGVLVANEQVLGPPCIARNGVQGDCRLLIKCVRFFFEIESLQSSPCLLPSGMPGVCCPHSLVLQSDLVENKAEDAGCPSNIICPPPPPVVVIPNIRASDIAEAANVALNNIRQRQRFQDSLFRKGVFVKKKTSAFASQRFKQTNRFSSTQGLQALTALETSQQLRNAFKLDKDQGRFALPQFSVKGSRISDTCPVAPTRCVKDAQYRTVDGTCNNKEHPEWGQSNIQLQRLLPPEYEDGVESPRTSDLPSPRSVSTATISSQTKENAKYTLMLMQWGQFVDHDITHTPVVKGSEESGIMCCENGDFINERNRHRECFPISLPDNDRAFSKFGQKCMEFVRSMPAPRSGCNFGPREQVNQITAWLDGSNVYGSDEDEASKLRLLGGGRLRVTRVMGRDLLPLNPDECSDDERRRYCFSAGDLRCNEQLELTVTHTVWMREHNRVAGQLQQLNPQWTDEQLYQEARKIVIAQLQHITYKEWLPIILGNKYMETWDMVPSDGGYTDKYAPDVNPGITNIFATAAFRFGHSLIAGTIDSYNLFGSKIKSLPLTKSQFAPYDLYDNNTLESFVRGLTTQKAQELDSAFSPELTEHLFQQENEEFGLDLVSLNIQRGRDHGLAPYNAWRQLCGQERVTSWKMLSQVFPSMNVARLQALYKSVDDIDVFIGGILEPPTDGSLLGPTFLCIIGDQFQRIRTADRFWYEEESGGFTPNQLTQIRKTSLARVLCDNSDAVSVIQERVFHVPDVQNRRLPCEDIKSIDLTAWKQ